MAATEQDEPKLPAGWDIWTDAEKNDYLCVLECACRVAFVEPKIIKRMSQRVENAVVQFYEQRIKEYEADNKVRG